MHDSVIDHSGTDLLHNNIINEASIQTATGLSNSNIFQQEYIMQLNDVVTMTTLQSKFLDDYMDHDSDAGVLMSTLLFPLTFAFSDTSEIVDFKACLCTSIYLNHY